MDEASLEDDQDLFIQNKQSNQYFTNSSELFYNNNFCFIELKSYIIRIFNCAFLENLTN